MCDQYYKATSVVHNSDGSVTMYTQANQVPQYNVYTGGTVTCEALGMGSPTDGVEYSGILSFTMTNPPLGTNATLLWPPASNGITFTPVQCLTPKTATYMTQYPHCYAEFPLSPNGEFMAMDTNYFVPTATVQLCGSQTTPFSQCSIHQVTEITQFNLLDATSNQALTNIQTLGTTFQSIWMPNICGTFPCYYGGFSHYSLLGSLLAVSFQSSQPQPGSSSLALSEAVLFNMTYTGNWGNWISGGGAVLQNAHTGGKVTW